MLDAEELIRQRLEAITGVAGVHGLPRIDEEAVAGKKLPALFVAPTGYRVAQVMGQLRSVQIVTEYIVVVAIRNVEKTRDGQTPRQHGGEIATSVIQHLLGWQPSPAYQPMQMTTNPPMPMYQKDGLVLLTLGFECPQIINRLSD